MIQSRQAGHCPRGQVVMDGNTQGTRIRAFLENAEDEVAVIAPFIKVDALRSLLEVIPTDLHLRCVSRWLPRDIAAGITDPEVLDLLEVRGNFSLSLAIRTRCRSTEAKCQDSTL